MNKIMVSGLLMRLAESLGTELQTSRMGIYLDELKDIPMDKLIPALDVLKYKRFPSLFEIIDEAGCRPPTIQEEAEGIWRKIRDFKGPLFGMDLTGTALQVVKAMGGRGQYEGCFGSWPASQESFKRKEFVAQYAELQKSEVDYYALPTFQEIR